MTRDLTFPTPLAVAEGPRRGDLCAFGSTHSLGQSHAERVAKAKKLGAIA